MDILSMTLDQFKRLWRDRQFNAEVSATAGNQITVIRTGETQAEGPYAAAAGLAAAVSPGDKVKVEMVGGAFQVAYKVES